jgi:hypothetical protein
MNNPFAFLGFVKERVKITFVQDPRILRVNGERPIQDNRWSRFNEAFPVPENCNVDKIEASFRQGILTITMPKTVISQLRPAEEAKTIQNPSSTPKPKPQEVAEEIPPPEPTSAKTAPQKAPSPPKSAVDPNTQKGQDATPPKAASTTTDTQKQMDIYQKSIEKKDKLVKENGKDKETNEFERVVERNKAKGKEAVQKIAESVMAEKTFVKNILEKKKESAETGIRQKVKNLANKKLNEEEKQNLINVGVAVLVIVALGFGGYASYRYSSSAKPEK